MLSGFPPERFVKLDKCSVLFEGWSSLFIVLCFFERRDAGPLPNISLTPRGENAPPRYSFTSRKPSFSSLGSSMRRTYG